jgi:hypothetical protein
VNEFAVHRHRVGSSKPLVSPEKTAAGKQRNHNVLVQVAKCSGRKAAEL